MDARFRIAVFENRFDEVGNLVALGEAVSKEENVDVLCRRESSRRGDKTDEKDRSDLGIHGLSMAVP